MTEKHTEHIGFNYISKLLNIDEYNTTGNKELFGSKIPDGWLLVGNNLLIIEYKPKTEMKEKGYKQLARYAKLALTNKPELTIYCMLGIGDNKENFALYITRYNQNENNKSMTATSEQTIKNIFSNVNASCSLQSIHNMLVNNYKFEDAKDLHDILTIIVVSILDDDFRKYYEMSEDKVDKEFITDLVNLVETKITDSTVNYKHILEKFKRLPFRNSFSICKTIYNSYKANPKLIGQLFQQFKKYNNYVGSNNEIWTPPVITELIYSVGKKYINKDKFTILDPCVGFNALIYPWIQHNENINVKGCEISSRLYFMGKLDLMIKGITEPLTYCRDFMATDEDLLKADICVCNPPYTRNISNGYDCLDFVNKSVNCAKTSIFIFPKSRLINCKSLKEEFLKKAKLLEVIELGDNVFKGVGTGDIVIIVCQKLKDKNKDIKTKYYDLRQFSEEYKCIPHRNENVLTEKGKQLMTDYVNGAVSYEEYTPTVDNIVPVKTNELMFENIDKALIEQYDKLVKDINSSYFMSTSSKRLIYEIITKEFNEMETELNKLYNNRSDVIKSVNFGDVFELVKHKTTDKRKHNIGIHPFVYRTQFNNGVDDYIDYYDLDTEDDILCIADLSGFVSVHTGKFSIGDHMIAIKLTEKYKHLDVDKNILLLRSQLMSGQWKYNNLLTYNKIKGQRINIYQNIGTDLPTDSEREYMTDPVNGPGNEQANNLTRIRLMDYFEQVKFKALPSNYETSEQNNIYPLIGAKKTDNGVVKYIDKYTIDIGENKYMSLCKQGDGGCGYCFIRTGKFSATSSVYILKPKPKYKDVFDLEDNIKFISLQISNMGFNFSHAINSERLNNIHVYVNKIANPLDS